MLIPQTHLNRLYISFAHYLAQDITIIRKSSITSATFYDILFVSDRLRRQLFPLARGGPAEFATRERSAGSQRRRTAFVGYFRAHRVALGPFDKSQHTHEKLLQ